MKDHTFDIEKKLVAWKAALMSAGNLLEEDVTELEGHLRDEIDDLGRQGLSDTEAFLIGTRRIGETNELAAEYYKINGRKLWKQLELPGLSELAVHGMDIGLREFVVISILTVLSACASQIPYLFGTSYLADNPLPAVRIAIFAFMPWLTIYMIWKRKLGVRYIVSGIILYGTGAIILFLYPFSYTGDTLGLSLLHIALLYWATFGFLYISHGTRRARGYIDFLRFSGELFVYTVLVVLGGGVLLTVGNAVFAIIDVDVSEVTERHLVVAGAFAAPVVGAYLVEAKRHIIENIAPILARLFVPLFALVLSVFLIVMVVSGPGLFMDREPLIVLDLLLFLVLAMVFYSISSRSDAGNAAISDYANALLIAVSVLVDGIALSAIVYRLASYGVTPNRLAALGENVLMLVHLVGILAIYIRYIRRKAPFDAVETYMVRYIPVYAIWFVFVAAVLPVIFSFA